MLTKAQNLGIACLGYWSRPPELNMSALVWTDNALDWTQVVSELRIRL